MPSRGRTVPVVEGEPKWGKLPMRLGWVFKKAHRPRGAVATARAFWHVVICRYVYEVCACGRPDGAAIRTYWLAPDPLWERVNGRSEGVMCTRCFTERAAEQGVPVAWLAAPMDDVDRLMVELGERS